MTKRKKKPLMTPREIGFRDGAHWIERPEAADCTDREAHDMSQDSGPFDKASEKAEYRKGFIEGVNSMLLPGSKVSPLPE